MSSKPGTAVRSSGRSTGKSKREIDSDFVPASSSSAAASSSATTVKSSPASAGRVSKKVKVDHASAKGKTAAATSSSSKKPAPAAPASGSKRQTRIKVEPDSSDAPVAGSSKLTSPASSLASSVNTGPLPPLTLLRSGPTAAHKLLDNLNLMKSMLLKAQQDYQLTKITGNIDSSNSVRLKEEKKALRHEIDCIKSRGAVHERLGAAYVNRIQKLKEQMFAMTKNGKLKTV